MVVFSGCLWLFAPNFWEVAGDLGMVFVSFYERKFSNRDTMRWLGTLKPYHMPKICLNFLHSQVAGMEIPGVQVLAPVPPGGISTSSDYLIFLIINLILTKNIKYLVDAIVSVSLFRSVF